LYLKKLRETLTRSLNTLRTFMTLISDWDPYF